VGARDAIYKVNIEARISPYHDGVFITGCMDLVMFADVHVAG
jgi:hypothetical protein